MRNLKTIQNDIELHFDSNELVQILQGLIQQKSENPPGLEKDVAIYIRNILEQQGIDSKLSWVTPERPNIMVRLKGVKAGPTMLYNGHLDVVPAGNHWSTDPYKGHILNGKMYGRGTADMKSGVSAMIYAAIVLQRLGNPFAGELILYFNVDEERVNLGMKKFLTENITADYAVISEPTELNICVAHKGIARYRVRTKGTAVHAGNAPDPDNAISKMARFISAIERLGEIVGQRTNPVTGPASLTITKINGGTAANVIPDFCEIEIDRRLLPGETNENVYRELQNVLDKVAEEYSIPYEMECYLFLPASYIEKEHQLVKDTLHVASFLKKGACKVQAFHATCEAPFFSVAKGIPTIIFGPGSLKQAHVIDEYVVLQDVIDASRIFIELVLYMLKDDKL